MSFKITYGLTQFVKVSSTISNLKKQYPFYKIYSLELQNQVFMGNIIGFFEVFWPTKLL